MQAVIIAGLGTPEAFKVHRSAQLRHGSDPRFSMQASGPSVSGLERSDTRNSLTCVRNWTRKALAAWGTQSKMTAADAKIGLKTGRMIQ